jgi:hypothetical protein
VTESDQQSGAVARRVRELLENGFLQLPRDAHAEAGGPVAVRASGGAIHSWMVPFTAGTKLIAWAQMSPSLDLLRFSLLAGGRIEACPNAADWLDVARISAQIVASAAAGSTLSAPVLTYDRDPSRLVWMAESREPGGTIRKWFAAGSSIWEDSGGGDVTGGPQHRL